MNENKYFLHQIKHTNGNFDKGIVVKDTYEAALQSYHVCCMITESMSNAILLREQWAKVEETQAAN